MWHSLGFKVLVFNPTIWDQSLNLKAKGFGLGFRDLRDGTRGWVPVDAPNLFKLGAVLRSPFPTDYAFVRAQRSCRKNTLGNPKLYSCILLMLYFKLLQPAEGSLPSGPMGTLIGIHMYQSRYAPQVLMEETLHCHIGLVVAVIESGQFLKLLA